MLNIHDSRADFYSFKVLGVIAITEWSAAFHFALLGDSTEGYRFESNYRLKEIVLFIV